ncbi:hypothetical protein PENSPDRAFT_608176 [Peniophora sp. CONT]|nr:hypothetical protein PENSPDRAFT_608176 [Peniophora sp. CONT]
MATQSRKHQGSISSNSSVFPSISKSQEAAGTPEPLYQVKLLAALRSGDPARIHPFLAEISQERRASQDSGLNSDAGAGALHLAIRCASVDTVRLLLSHRAISPNAVHPPQSGTTALHLAASLGRVDVVTLLLEQEGIDDTLQDSQGKTVKDVAHGRDVQRAIHDSRSFLTASFRSQLRTYILSAPSAQPPAQLVIILSSPRARLLNLSYLDDDSGTTLLHEASRRKDASLVELAMRGGADIFVRDRRGRTVQDVVGKDDKMRAFLRQFARRDTTLIEDGRPSGPPELKGYLNKYTNVARGWGTRWFVLKDGVLSYYRHQEDETIASRGSIAMRTAILRLPSSSDTVRFEIHSTPSHGHHSVQKWYIKANHPVEATRWTQAIGRAIEIARQGSPPAPIHENSESESSLQSLASRSSLRLGSLRPGHKGSSTRSSSSHMLGSPTLVHKPKSDVDSLASSKDMTDDEDGRSPDMSGLQAPERALSLTGSGEEESGSIEQLDSAQPPHEGIFFLNANSATAQLDLTADLLADLLKTDNSPARTAELQRALQDSMGSTRGLVSEFVGQARERDDWWRARLAREVHRQTVWEESLQSVVKEGEALERELREQARTHRRGRSASEGRGDGTLRSRPSLFVVSPPALEEEAAENPLSAVGERETRPMVPTRSGSNLTVTDHDPPSPHSRRLSLSHSTLRRHRAPPGSSSPSTTRTDFFVSPPPTAATIVPGMAEALDTDMDGDVDTDEEDEFFDAIETGALPNLIINEALTAHAPVLPDHVNIEQYKGYEHPRKELPIKSDDRPPTSLWSILKHSIGKDLTKISFPVFFNEPTSMLQRMAEDMEFSECLDAAAQEPDQFRRIAFVAAFAMSNYSSTIGRIAKPFNPMLSETFEYVSHDKEYRYVSEQVSHHPPISACYAESPRWHYFGEVDAQNKFMGKSFEIRPTGVAHAELVVPVEFGPNYPKFESPITGSAPRVVEHYSWKKVTTNVSGFIVGSPTIDHYGEMTVTNHRTKDTCVLIFKPRGWRAKDAFEISGYVTDASGNMQYEIAGRWNSQLVARAVNAPSARSGALNPDVDSTPTEFVLLWRNSVKPAAPFNLTPFAITLNDCPPDTLKPYLPPTDCRLRPDQRAFELGKYERANELKVAQEEHQRMIRKKRETGELPPHCPRWFTAETDGDTGERVWTATRTTNGVLEYWNEREKVWKTGGKEPYKDVDPIFVDEEV